MYALRARMCGYERCQCFCALSTQALSQHFGRFFQSPKVIEGLVDILLHGQPATEGGRGVAGFVPG